MSSQSPPLSSIMGIGPQRAELLAKLGLVTHDDLLHYVPRRHEDRRHLTPLSEAQEGAAITVRGKVHQARGVQVGRAAAGGDVAPAGVTRKEDIVIARWYAFRPWGVKEGCELFLYGKVTRDKKGHWVMKQPEYEIIQEDAESYIHIDRVVPIYALTDGLTQRVMRRIMFEATQKTPFAAPYFYPEPPGLMPRQEAFRVIHFPESLEREERARQRLAYDEFFVLQCVVAQRRLNRVTGFRPRPNAVSKELSTALAQVAAVSADRRAAAGHGGDRRRSGAGTAHEPAAARRRGRGQDLRRDLRHAARGRGGRAGRADGAHADPRRAARAESAPLAGAARRAHRSFHRQHEEENRPAAGRGTRSLQHRQTGRAGDAQTLDRHRHACPPLRPLRRRQARPDRHRRAAQVRRAAAAGAQPQGPESRHPRHDRHADPAHAGHDPLRRPRCLHPRRIAAGPPADHDQVPLDRRTRQVLGLPAEAGRRGAAGLRRLSAGRGVGEGRRQVGEGGVRAAEGPAAAASGWACCTASSRATRRSGS